MALSKYDERKYQVQVFDGVKSVYHEVQSLASVGTQRCNFEHDTAPTEEEMTDAQRSALSLYISRLENEYEMEMPENLRALYRQIIVEENTTNARAFRDKYGKSRLEVVQGTVAKVLAKHKQRAELLQIMLGNDPIDAMWDAVEMDHKNPGPGRARRGQQVDPDVFREQMATFAQMQKALTRSVAPALPICPEVERLALEGKPTTALMPAQATASAQALQGSLGGNGTGLLPAETQFGRPVPNGPKLNSL